MKINGLVTVPNVPPYDQGSGKYRILKLLSNEELAAEEAADIAKGNHFDCAGEPRLYSRERFCREVWGKTLRVLQMKNVMCGYGWNVKPILLEDPVTGRRYLADRRMFWS